MNRHGATYAGNYELKGSRVTGIVAHDSSGNIRPPISVVVARDGIPIGCTKTFNRRQNNFLFSIELASEFNIDDVLRERVTVFALDRVGGRSALKVSGALQLSYIKQAYGTPSTAELTIDFSLGGNSRQYTKDGWYNPEPDHTWTAGLYSVLEVPLSFPDHQYGLEMLVWPFVARDKILDQRLEIRIQNQLASKHTIRPGHNLVEYELLPEFTAAKLVIRLDHPDAARPRDYYPNQDGRMLALAFKTLKVLRRTMQ